MFISHYHILSYFITYHHMSLIYLYIISFHNYHIITYFGTWWHHKPCNFTNKAYQSVATVEYTPLQNGESVQTWTWYTFDDLYTLIYHNVWHTMALCVVSLLVLPNCHTPDPAEAEGGEDSRPSRGLLRPWLCVSWVWNCWLQHATTCYSLVLLYSIFLCLSLLQWLQDKHWRHTSANMSPKPCGYKDY